MEPFASLAGAVRPSVPRLLINRDLVGPFAFQRRPGDVVQLGDVVGGVQELVAAIGWRREMDTLMAPVRNARKTAADVPPLPCVSSRVFMSSLSFSSSPGCSRDTRVTLIQFGRNQKARWRRQEVEEVEEGHTRTAWSDWTPEKEPTSDGCLC